MCRTFFATTTLLTCLTLPALAVDAPAAPAAPAPAASAEPATAPAAPAAAPESEAPAAAAAPEIGVPDSILRLVIDREVPNLATPWVATVTNGAIQTGVSVSLDGKNYVLAGSGASTFATKIKGPEDAVLSLVAQSTSLQLALLEIKDAKKSAEFFKKHAPVALSQDWPSAVGLTGRTANEKDLPYLNGFVVETQAAVYGNVIGLRSVANLTDSGPTLQNFFKTAVAGPVIDEKGKLAGFHTGGLQQTEDKKALLATFVPAAELKLFITDAADGKYDGKWALKTALNLKPLANEALRAKLGIKTDVKGWLVTGEESAIAPFKPWDVLTAIGTHALKDNFGNTVIDGTINGPAMYHLDSAASAETKTAPVTVLRNGSSMQLSLPVARRGAETLPSYSQNNTAPRYFVFGPMCFEQATAELAGEMVKQRGAGLALSGNPIANYINDNTPKAPGDELVVLSHLFKHAATSGYAVNATPPHLASFPVVKSVNGQAVTSLRQLAKLLAEGKEPFIEISFHDKDAETLVFKREEMAKAASDAKKAVGIVEGWSPDLADILK